MRSQLATVVMACILAPPADADTYRLFLDTAGNAGADHAPHPGEPALSFTNPVLGDGGGRLFIYAQFHDDDQIIASPNYDVTVDGGLITEAWNYNGPGQDSLSGDRRWDEAAPNPALNPGGNTVVFTAINLTHMGLKNGAFADLFDVQHDSDNGATFGTTLLGYVDVVNDLGPASLWMTPAEGGCGQIWCETDIFFGFGDDPVNSQSIGQRSEIAEATIVPEPATAMMLMMAAATLLRSRQHRPAPD